MRPSVDLPQPDSPTRPTTSPSRTARIDVVDRVHRLVRRRSAPSARAILPGQVERLARSAWRRRAARAAAGRQAVVHAAGWKQRTARPGAGRLGRVDRAGLGRARAALAEGAARRQLEQRRRHAGDLRERRAAPVAARHRADQARACRDAAARRAPRPPCPCSTMRPAYITQISSARPATTERSCVIQISAVPALAAQLLRLVQDLRLDGDVERGGGLVGDDQVGLVEERDGDRHALAHAAGELVRIGAQPLLGRRDADALERLARDVRAPLSRDDVVVRPHGLDHLRVDAQHRVERHHRVLEDHRDAVAAHARACRSRRACARSSPFEQDAPADDAARRSTRPRIEKPVIDLARARFADQPEHLARRRPRSSRRRPPSPRPPW